MKTVEEYFLANETLDANEWRGVQQLANALSEFEPLAKRGNLGETVAERLVSLGIAEKGPSSSAYAARGMPVGYRLTELGWKLNDRGRYHKRKR